MPLLLQHEIARLMGASGSLGGELAEGLWRAAGIIAVLDEIVPLLQAVERSLHPGALPNEFIIPGGHLFPKALESCLKA